MSGPDAVSSLLRWYPPAWRQRYGDELCALMEDDLGGRPPSRRFRLSVAAAGLRERCHEAGVAGSGAPVTERLRGSSLLVLCAWAAFVVAGTSFAKLAEHSSGPVPAGARPLVQHAYDAVQVLGALGAAAVLLGALASVPSLVRFLAGGGWRAVRACVLRATAVSAVAAAGVVALVVLAHHLDVGQRNGGSPASSAAFVVVGLVAIAALGLWTAAAVVTVRPLPLPPKVLVVEGTLAAAVALGVVAMTAATAVWWGAVATSAPWVLWGTRPGTDGSAIPPSLVATMGLMAAASAVATYGARRAVVALRTMRGLRPD